MTIQQLNYIVALDTHRHFVKAAESCFVAQPTLTLQVKKLEEQINLVIFDRSKQPLEPTPMGEIFVNKARQILRDIEQLKQIVNDEKNMTSGKFRIGVIPSLAPYLLPLFLSDFSSENPNTQLEIKEWQSESIIKGLENNTLDIGILATPLFEPNIREVPVFYEPFMLYAHPGHPLLSQEHINAQSLDEKDLWILEQGHCFRNQILNICEMDNLKNEDRKISFEGGSIETLKNMIQKTFGYTLIPELSYHKSSDNNQVKRFENPEPAREISIVVHKSFTKELLITNLRKAILKNLPKHFKTNTKFVTVQWRQT